MLWNYIKVSFRNIRRHKLFSAINIISLTLSITICLAVLLLIKYQTDFDTFHPHPDRTWRIITEATHDNGAVERFATVPLPLAENLENDYPFIETAVQVLGEDIYFPAFANDKLLDGKPVFSEPEFFEIFGFRLAYGNPATALDRPNSVILTPETAQRFFEDKNPIGESITIQGMETGTVTGVLENNLEQSHLDFDFLVSLSTFEINDTGYYQGKLQEWSDLRSGHIYLLLTPEARAAQLEEILSSLSQQVSSSHELRQNMARYDFEAQSLAAVSPGEELSRQMDGGKVRSAADLLVFSVVALIILLLACFNYTNLSIARALKRSREVGIYKLLGAYRTQIMGQFVTQSVLVAATSLVLAYALLPFIPFPPDIVQEISNVTPDAELIGWFVLFTFFTGILAGGFPAWLLTSLQPAQVLKNSQSLQLIKGLTFRKMMVTAQFSVSIILLITASVVYQQSQFAATADYGFQQDNIINLNLQRNLDPQLMKNELSGLSTVEMISAVSRPFGFFSQPEDFSLTETGEPIHGDKFNVDQNLIPNLELSLVAGRNFSEESGQNPDNHAIINEHFLNVTEWNTPAEAIGKTIWWRDNELQIIGVVKDFNYKSFSLPIRPLVLYHQPDATSYLNIRVAPENQKQFLSELEMVWQKVAPHLPLQYEFYDETIYDSNAKEQTVASLGYYALIALSIACLGLLGMVTYTVEVRTQEVGIRKVLGAGIANLLGLLSREFIWLLVLATGIGLPVGYWLGQQFLNTYAYHITIGFGTVIFGVAIMGGLGLLAIGTQTWQVARKNPVEAIRTE